ncbi:MAG: glycosyltransferase family 4 protein, partial [Burkholderiales bacterium]
MFHDGAGRSSVRKLLNTICPAGFMRHDERRLLYLVSEDWYFVGHRIDLARAAREAGYTVAVATRVGIHRDAILDAGIQLLPLDLKRSGKNPITETVSIWQIARAYIEFKPHIVHHVALKPILYGALAARVTRVPAVVNALTGLGYAFSSVDAAASLIRPVLECGYSFALRGSHVILQNTGDLALLTSRGIVVPEQCSVVPGAGCRLNEFTPTPEPIDEALVVLPARMLRDKGVVEFVAAARILKSEGIPARFALVGIPDPENPASIDETQLRAWTTDGTIEWWGWRNDMAAVYASAHIVCLPSYREGLPKSLIEAAACGRP